jgi:peptidoglycan hydrolase-like protein with peptidoglycan-binding domain
MQAIQPPVNPNSLPATIANLQDALLLLLQNGAYQLGDAERQRFVERLRPERDAQKYDDITRKLVAMFQGQRNIQPTSEVDEPTANAINAFLREFGVLDGQGGWTEVVKALDVQGRTLSAINLGTDHLSSIDQKIGTLGKAASLALNMRGDAVKDLHAQLGSVGVALPVSETTDGIFGVGTRDALLQVQLKYDLATTGVLDDATRNALAIAVGNVAHPSRVEGRIFLDNGLPAAKIKLSIVNKGFGEDATELGEIETDERGFYALPYDRNGAAANIEVHAFDADGTPVRLSNPKVNADRSEVLNLVAPSRVQSQANEFVLMANDLKGLVGGDIIKLALAQEDSDRQDLSLLHQPTGWDARLIATAATAAKVTAVTGIAHDALYGAFRAGLPHDAEALALVSTEAFATALTRAKDAGLIALDDAQMRAAQTAFETFKLATRRNMIVPGALSSVGDMLEKARIEPTHKVTFEKLALLHDGDDTALWTEAKVQGIPTAQIASLQLQGKLAYLTLNNAPLTEELQDEIDSQDNMAQLVEKDLYRKDEWAMRLKALASDNNVVNPEKLAKLIPTAYTQKEVHDRLDAYADDLARKVRQSFPTHVVNRMLEKDDLKLGAQHAELKAPVQTFLKNAVDKGFQLGRTPVDQFLKQHSETVFDGIAEDKKGLAEAGAKLLTRAYQMTPNDETMTTLLALGFTSARQVVAISKADFVERYWERFGSRKATETVYDKSVQISSVTFNIYTLGKKIDSAPPIMAISGSPEKHQEAKDKLKSLLKEYPTMESLFGSLDFCECEHCRSVLSPAAYLVDLLRFVDPPTQDWEHTLSDWRHKHNEREYTGPDYNFLKPYDALIQRRPDLPHLPLTCENTNTALPYIDLVNEILEYFVANTRLDANAAHDTGEATSAELMAEPYNIIPKAYDTLKGARYPLTLPFDLWLETVRRFCNYFETPLWQVLETFRPSNDLFAPAENPAAYYRVQIFAEYLSLSPDEYASYITSTMADLPNLYGYDGDTEASVRAKLKSAKTLSRRLGVSYKELVELVKTAFVNPKLHELVTLRKLGAEVSDVFRFKKHAAYLPVTQEQKDEAPYEDAEFETRLQKATEKFKPTLPNFDAKQWLDDTWDQHQFEKVLVLRDPNAGGSFDETTVCYADIPDEDVDTLDYVKLNLFVRLWKRLGWTMEETDRALQAFLPAKAFLPPNGAITEATLGTALKTALIYLAHLKELTELTNVGKNSRLKLLTLWADLPTKGKNSLYAQLFLTRNILKDDAIFDDPFGNYLSKPDVFLKDHMPALQAALNLTADEIAQILQDGNTGDEQDVNQAMLSLANVSMLYRYGLLAKALKLSVGELIALKALSGLNPFKPLSVDPLDENIENDYPFTQTLAFVHVAQQVKASAFAISDLDYLLRHRFDALGKYRDNSDARLAWIRTLAAELHTIASDYTVPANADSVDDDVLRQKMTLVFAPDVVETFMGFWLDKAVYSVTKASVPLSQRLTPATYGANRVSVSYDETRTRQQVTHVGVLIDAAKTTLLSQIPPPAPTDLDAIAAREIFADLLGEIVSKSSAQFKKFFSDYFDGLLTLDDFFGTDVPTTAAEKRLSLLQKILPFLQAKLTHQMVLQALTTQTGGDTALIASLLTNSDFLALPDANTQSLMARFEGLGQRGLTAVLTPSDPDAQPIPKTAEDVEVKASDTCKQAHWRGFIEVPQSGAYRFYAKLGKKDATVDLRFDGVLEPILNATAARDDDELSGFTELKSGVLYVLTLEASNLQDGMFELLVKGETTPKDKLSQLVVLPQAAVDGAMRAYTMLTKALQLAQGVGLSERDIRHILAPPADFGMVDWRLLPTQAITDMDSDVAKADAFANAIKLFNGLILLMGYAAFKRDLAGGSDDLIAIFESARRKESVPELCKQIATLTRRKLDVVQSTATELMMTAPEHFADEARMERLWQALQIVEKFGVQVASLKKWLTPTPDANVALDVRNTIKSRYEPETWQRLAKAIFDPLRQRQRDALVAHIMHIKEELDSVEKLFEYFLIDPGMEPVVQTSRLRLAISSLQTFIQRCFLSLEKQVHPSVLNAQHWSWMKRYRIWEANRKIFLFPENWLEPEWRDDKTHLYQELESSLLQGDVTNQLAEDALYVYLKKLDQLARLEIVTMYAEEKPLGPPTMHVIGRTYGLPHQYFYRRYAHQMWTAWEPVTTEIDGDHIVAVIWRERLHLFWLTFMEKVEESAGGPRTSETGALGTLHLDKLVAAAAATSKGAVKRMLDMQLNWSEYFQGEWTVRESSGFGNPFTLPPNQLFDASKVFVSVSKEADPGTGADGAVWINLNGWYEEDAFHISQKPYFRVVSKNSRPQLKYDFGLFQPISRYSPKNKTYNRYEGSGALSVTFVQKIVTTDGNKQASPPAPQPILAKGGSFTLLPSSNQMMLPNAEFAPLISPVFYADDVYTFFVEPSLTETTVDRWEGYTIIRPSHKPKWDEYILHPSPISPVLPLIYKQMVFKPKDVLQPEPVDSLALHAIKPNLDALTQPSVAVQFGDAVVGRTGRLQDLGNITHVITSLGGGGNL